MVYRKPTIICDCDVCGKPCYDAATIIDTVDGFFGEKKDSLYVCRECYESMSGFVARMLKSQDLNVWLYTLAVDFKKKELERDKRLEEEIRKQVLAEYAEKMVTKKSKRHKES